MLPEKNGPEVSVQDAVLVNLAPAIFSRVEVLHTFLCLQNQNVRGEKAVERPLQGGAIHRVLRLEVRHLPQGMHAGIGPTRADQVDGLSHETSQLFFDRSLNRRTFGLYLPPQIVFPVIFKGKFDITHPAPQIR